MSNKSLIGGYNQPIDLAHPDKLQPLLARLPQGKKQLEDWAAAFCRQLSANGSTFDASSKFNYLLNNGEYAPVVVFLGHHDGDRSSLHALIILSDSVQICTVYGHEPRTARDLRRVQEALLDHLECSVTTSV